MRQSARKIAVSIYLAIIFVAFTAYLVIVLYANMHGEDVSYLVLDSQNTHAQTHPTNDSLVPKISFK